MPYLPKSDSQKEFNPHKDFWKAKIPSCNRRANWHDYTSRCHYMITIIRNDSLNIPFCTIYNRDNERLHNLNPEIMLSQIGEIIKTQIEDTCNHYPSIKIPNYVIMPDHVHLHIFITEKSTLSLGMVVNYLKGHCTKRLKELDSGKAQENSSLFQKGFNDRIVTKAGMKDNLINYIKDNPRRYLIKRAMPKLFVSCHVVTGFGEELPIFGNFLLLKEPCKAVLTVSSHDSPSDMRRKKSEWDEVVRQGGVLVSPFISPAEKKLRDEYIEQGCKFILLQQGGFPPRYKPAGKLFELCSQGRLLIIGEGEHSYEKIELRRATCLHLNERARKIASQQNGNWTLRTHHSH